MSSLKSKDPISIGGKTVALSGRFRLTCNRDPKKFFVTNLNSFIPKGKMKDDKVNFIDENGPRPFLLIQSVTKIYKPDESEIDAHNVAVLIQHPEVRLVDMSDKEHEALVNSGLKKANPEFALLNLDKAIMDEHEAKQEMIDIEYQIMSRKSTLNKKRLMYITSALHLPTRSEIQDEKRYIAFLQNQLITHLRGNPADRPNFEYFYEKINDAEVLYFIDEMIKMGIIEEFGGMYKIDNKPVGFEIKNIKDYFASNEDEYAQFKLKVQTFHKDKVTS